MTTRSTSALLFIAAIAVTGASSSASAQPAPPRKDSVRIVVSPEMLVSQDGDVPHIETMVAANPRNSAQLIGASIVGGRPGGGYHCKTYASQDGGASWVDRSFPELIRWGGGDPQVVFTPAGTGVFTCLVTIVDGQRQTRAAIMSWRSTDGGLTWTGPVNLGVSYDHEMLTVDRTAGRFAGRLYMSALYGRHYTLGLFRSDDDGRSWIGPVEITDGKGHGANVTNIVVLSDGELLLTWIDFPVTPAQDSSWPGTRLWTAVSKDGGVTFSEPRPGPALGPHWKRSNPEIWLHSDPVYAADPGERHRDRVYLAFTRFEANGTGIMVSRSDDRGATWSEPVPLDRSRAAGVRQFMPRVAVNEMGTVGISYFDSRESRDGTAWHEYFTASIDGGETFLPPVRVSGEASRPGSVGHQRLEPTIFTMPDGAIQMALISSASRWANGGDYSALTVDSSGVFHPFWPDARTGTYQIWTAKIRVDRPPLPQRPSPLDAYFRPAPPPGPPAAPTSQPVDVSRRVELLFDPTRYDSTRGEVEIRVRVRNVSNDTIWAPLSIEVTDFGDGVERENRENAPAILNAGNGKSGTGAVFDFSGATGSDRLLVPDGKTGAVVWRIRLKDPRRTPGFRLLVRGVLR